MKHLKLLFLFSVLLIYSCSDDIETSPLADSSIEIEKRQFTMNGFIPVTTCEASNLTYYIDDCFDGTPYEEVIPGAMQLYNDSPTSLFFTQVFTDDADLVFSCIEGGGGTCGGAQADFPVPDHDLVNEPLNEEPTYFDSGGSIGSEVAISTGNWIICPCDEEELDLCFFTHTILHEVGHTLGLYHNSIHEEIQLAQNNTLNPNAIGVLSDVNYDAGSIMNAANYDHEHGTFCDASCVFNDNDILALQSLYPAPEIIGSEEVCNMTSYIYCLSEGLTGTWNPFDFKWVPGNTPTSPLPSNCFAYSWTEPGVYTISVDVCGKFYEKEITILDCF